MKRRRTARTRQGQKQKGRHGVELVRQLLLAYFDAQLTAADVYIPVGTVPGEDLHLSPKARRLFPFALEVKNQEHLDIWKALEQAATHGAKNGYPGVVFFRRSRSRLYVALEAGSFLSLL